MNGSKKNKDKKYAFEINSLPKPLDLIFGLLVVIAIISGLVLSIDGWFYFLNDTPLIAILICTFAPIVPILVLLFLSRRRIVWISEVDVELEHKCILCLKNIQLGEKYISCPFCEKPIHLSETENWLKHNSRCPNCARNIKKISIREYKSRLR